MTLEQIQGVRRAMRACAMRWRRDAKKLTADTDTALLHGLTYPCGEAKYWLLRAIHHRDTQYCNTITGRQLPQLKEEK